MMLAPEEISPKFTVPINIHTWKRIVMDISRQPEDKADHEFHANL